MDEYFGDNFENCNLLYEMATFEHFANHNPQPRKCSEVLNCDINKFMFICSQCSSEFESADEYYVHQMLEHQSQCSLPGQDLDSWFEKELLEEFLVKPDAPPKLKEFYESVDKILSMDDTNLGSQEDYILPSLNDSSFKSAVITDLNEVSVNLNLVTDKDSPNQFMDSNSLLGQTQVIISHNEPSEDTEKHPKTKTLLPDRKRKKKRSSGKCDVCNRIFNDTYNLRIHKMIHTGEMPFQCEDCGKGFRQYNKLKIHSIIHTNEKPFVCDLCEKGFRFRNYLAIHKRLHTGEKPYKCKHCDEHFHSMHNRRLHFKSAHSQEKENFTCMICGKALSTKFYLQVHIKRHASRNNFECKNCGEILPTLDRLKEHTSQHHTKEIATSETNRKELQVAVES